MLCLISLSAHFSYGFGKGKKAGIPPRLILSTHVWTSLLCKQRLDRDLQPCVHTRVHRCGCQSRLFSVDVAFLFTPMSLTWFSKGKGKDRDAKDRQLNGHRFSAGACLGPTVCVVCDKPASGKELLHCPSESKFNSKKFYLYLDYILTSILYSVLSVLGCTAIVHKGCKDSVPPCLKVRVLSAGLCWSLSMYQLFTPV